MRIAICYHHLTEDLVLCVEHNFLFLIALTSEESRVCDKHMKEIERISNPFIPYDVIPLPPLPATLHSLSSPRRTDLDMHN